MRYLTARKRAEGKGAAGTGTEHFWYMKLSGVGLALIIPVFLVAFGRALGGDRTEVMAAFAHPGMAILTGLVIFFGLRHYASGAQTMIEDYSHGSMRRGLIIAVTVLSYGLIATGLFALAKIAL
ncbi:MULTISPECIES: succinate dehydrogenase, hydrophobic membrane anchor protein [unclassified Roseovarius]|jgi:succinate dehydrogenase / fumarate reductase membrane anchor subunit|uniref:succinate dehydrogenase, hydrophobic membrane anchor protein n=1 Tax=unclassified Roseovarius TaxID=2614913 RepID=UPI0000686FD7|nr:MULTISPECIES: succinate dehydrogenase, hydrophobic membrane anchor protein [unclassified Roseovarius]EAQ23684.1 putative succinate dehydrogenase, hydrophobic membrane anchorprotein [Roseovarius sp. 217]KJS43286.1 MAG: succinate dehydrogenase [Roseovarius sp. BRH_c41]